MLTTTNTYDALRWCYWYCGGRGGCLYFHFCKVLTTDVMLALRSTTSPGSQVVALLPFNVPVFFPVRLSLARFRSLCSFFRGFRNVELVVARHVQSRRSEPHRSNTSTHNTGSATGVWDQVGQEALARERAPKAGQFAICMSRQRQLQSASQLPLQIGKRAPDRTWEDDKSF